MMEIQVRSRTAVPWTESRDSTELLEKSEPATPARITSSELIAREKARRAKILAAFTS